MMRVAAALALSGLLAAAGVAHVHADDAPKTAVARMMRMSAAQSDYIENCGGCHGFDGNSAPADVPVLKGRVGYFMCNSEGRHYLLRLPNVAHSRIADPQELAELMNFVVFGIGGTSTPREARPFTAKEVAMWRRQAMTSVSLIAVRRNVVAGLPKSCNVPASMQDYYPGQPGANDITVPSAIPVEKAAN